MSELTDKAKAYIQAYKKPPYGRAVEGTEQLLQEMMDELLKYENLKKKERLPELPCAVGDTLYVLTNDSDTGIETTACERIIIKKKRVVVQAPSICDDRGNAKWNFTKPQFGKKVFLDEKEAEEARDENNKKWRE